MESEIAELRSENSLLQSQVTALEHDKDELELENEQLTEELETANSTIENLEDEKEALETQVAAWSNATIHFSYQELTYSLYALWGSTSLQFSLTISPGAQANRPAFGLKYELNGGNVSYQLYFGFNGFNVHKFVSQFSSFKFYQANQPFSGYLLNYKCVTEYYQHNQMTKLLHPDFYEADNIYMIYSNELAPQETDYFSEDHFVFSNVLFDQPYSQHIYTTNHLFSFNGTDISDTIDVEPM